jgi:hypothetical protein
VPKVCCRGMEVDIEVEVDAGGDEEGNIVKNGNFH